MSNLPLLTRLSLFPEPNPIKGRARHPVRLLADVLLKLRKTLTLAVTGLHRSYTRYLTMIARHYWALASRSLFLSSGLISYLLIFVDFVR